VGESGQRGVNRLPVTRVQYATGPSTIDESRPQRRRPPFWLARGCPHAPQSCLCCGEEACCVTRCCRPVEQRRGRGGTLGCCCCWCWWWWWWWCCCCDRRRRLASACRRVPCRACERPLWLYQRYIAASKSSFQLCWGEATGQVRGKRFQIAIAAFRERLAAIEGTYSLHGSN
jgi:hypothetical protein